MSFTIKNNLIHNISLKNKSRHRKNLCLQRRRSSIYVASSEIHAELWKKRNQSNAKVEFLQQNHFY